MKDPTITVIPVLEDLIQGGRFEPTDEELSSGHEDFSADNLVESQAESLSAGEQESNTKKQQTSAQTETEPATKTRSAGSTSKKSKSNLDPIDTGDIIGLDPLLDKEIRNILRKHMTHAYRDIIKLLQL